MSAASVLPAVLIAPDRMTVWVLAAGTVLIVVLAAIGVLRHFEAVSTERRRARLQREFGPVCSRFLETQDSDRLAESLRTAQRRGDAWWRLKATFFVVIGRRPGWGTIPPGATL
jgi:hypothetical protein